MALLVGCSASAPEPAGRDRGVAACEGPVTAARTITAGGTYDLHVVDDSGAVGVTVATAEPVVLRGCVTSAGGVVEDPNDGTRASLTIERLRGEWTGAGEEGRFLRSELPLSVTVRDSELVGTSGIWVYGDLQDGITVDVLGNTATDIRTNTDRPVQFVQLDTVSNADVEIARNTVRNSPGASRVEDVVNVYESSGTPQRPIWIHDNDLRGAYSNPPGDRAYTGGGIMGGDGDPALVHDVLIERNRVVDTTNYGIAFAALSANGVIRDNCVLKTPDGDAASGDVGVYIWNPAGSGAFGGGRMEDNRVGWVRADGSRNDWWTPDADVVIANEDRALGNENLPDPISGSSC